MQPHHHRQMFMAGLIRRRAGHPAPVSRYNGAPFRLRVRRRFRHHDSARPTVGSDRAMRAMDSAPLKTGEGQAVACFDGQFDQGPWVADRRACCGCPDIETVAAAHRCGALNPQVAARSGRGVLGGLQSLVDADAASPPERGCSPQAYDGARSLAHQRHTSREPPAAVASKTLAAARAWLRLVLADVKKRNRPSLAAQRSLAWYELVEGGEPAGSG